MPRPSAPTPIRSRVVHHVTRELTTLAHCLEQNFQLSRARVEELIQLGAVWLGQVRVLEDRELPKGSHLRVHLQPLRFPADDIDWSRVVRHEEAEFLIVDKPAGVPVHATVDNLRDNVLFHLRRVRAAELYVTQRLDTPVTGLFVIAKTTEFQRDFNRRLAEDGVMKRYRALVEGEPARGRHVHYLEPGETTPARIRTEPQATWLRCELDVLSAEPRRYPISPRPYFDVEIALLTGRTHQIRAQMAALGCPVLGDKRYGSHARYTRLKLGKGIALTSTLVSWIGADGHTWRFEREPAWAAPTPPVE